jgi:hypothetical protein
MDLPPLPRKPLAKAAPPMESRTAHSIRFNDVEWGAICASARMRALQPAVFVRLLTMYALSIVQAPALAEASLGIPVEPLAGSLRCPRF